MSDSNASPPEGRADPRGHRAASPREIPLAGWKEVLVRSWKESSADQIGLIAAGVAFYIFLALVPLLAATVLTYGLLARPETVVQNMNTLTEILPEEVAGLIGEQLMGVVTTSGGKKGVGLVVALGIALFGARNAAGAVISALNIAYEEDEKRGFFRTNLLALGMTAAAVFGFVLALFAVAALGLLENLLPTAAGMTVVLLKAAVYLLLAAGAAAVAAVLYRFGPSREHARWRWLTPGGGFFAVGWVVLTLGFGIYVANFGNYGATYGSLSAVVVLLTWLYLSSYILLFGAELNSELEHQTVRDTTTGPPEPLGQRQAWVADHLPDGVDGNAELPSTGADIAPATGGATSEDSRAELRERINRGLKRLTGDQP